MLRTMRTHGRVSAHRITLSFGFCADYFGHCPNGKRVQIGHDSRGCYLSVHAS